MTDGTTMEATLVMLYAIRDHYLTTGVMIAMKPAGGMSKLSGYARDPAVAERKESLKYGMTVKEELGEEWLSNHWFRFGASSMANLPRRQATS